MTGTLSKWNDLLAPRATIQSGNGTSRVESGRVESRRVKSASAGEQADAPVRQSEALPKCL